MLERHVTIFDTVAPLVGAWIEICFERSVGTGTLSLLSWERGLKFYPHIVFLCRSPSLLSWERGLKFLKFDALIVAFFVAPLVGAWIEIRCTTYSYAYRYRSLLSWERGLKCKSVDYRIEQSLSLLSWERGLKSQLIVTSVTSLGRSSRGSVD